MPPDPLVPREDARATLEARRELGSEHEEALVESFVARIEQRLAERKPDRPAAAAPSPAVPVVSLVMAVPLVAIAGGVGGALGVAAVCAFLLLVNVLYRRPT